VLLYRLAPLDRAGPDALSFLVSPAYLSDFRSTTAGAVLIARPLAASSGTAVPRIIVDNPDHALRAAAEALHPERRPEPAVDSTARVAPDVTLPADASVGPFVVIGPGSRAGRGRSGG
jgi:UDP-3-O-[3-hydroxymyristoyl] glucosamine N-acyltransferase